MIAQNKIPDMSSLEKGQDFISVKLRVDAHSAFPSYYHKELSITYTSLKGWVSIGMGQNRYVLSPQKRFTVLSGVRHKIINAGSVPATLEVSITPAKVDNELGFKIWAGLDRDQMLQKNGFPIDFKTRCLLEIMTGLRRVGVLSILTRPIVWILARKAERNGLKKKLVKRYC